MKKLILGIGLLVSVFGFGQPANYAWIAEFDGNYTNSRTFNDGEASSTIRSLEVQATSSTDEYVIEWNNFNEKWQNGTTPYNQEFTLFHGGSGSPNGVLSTAATNGNYYTFQIDGLAYSNRDAVVMETDNVPIGFAGTSPVTENLATIYPEQDLVITVNLSGSKSAQEKAFVRYSSDGFTTSEVEEVNFASGTASSGTATIPGSVNTAGANISYYVFTTTVSATNASNHDLITLDLENDGGSNYSYTVENNWTTASGATNWKTASSWDANAVPPAGVPVLIEDDLTLNTDATVSNIEIATGITLTSESGQTRILSIEDGGSFINSGIFNANDGTIDFQGTGTFTSSNTFNSNTGTISATGSLTFTNSGFFNADTGTLIFEDAGTINASSITFNDVEISGGVDFGSGSTIDGNLTIFPNGYVNTNAPTYSGNSTLVYNGVSNYGVSDSWVQNSTSGQGVPQAVTITNNASVNFEADGDYRQCNGNLTIQNGSSLTLSTAIGGDLRIGDSGNWVNNNTTAGDGFTSNNRALRFVGGSGDQTMSNASGTTTIGYLLNEKSSGKLVLNNNLILDGTGSGTVEVLQLLTASNLDLNGNDIEIAGNQARAIEVDGNLVSITSSSAASITFEAGTGNAAVVSTNDGNLTVGSDINIEINKGVDFGNHTTIEGKLILEDNSFCDNTSPTYGSAAVLEYKTGSFNIGNEWVSGSNFGIGVPSHILLNLNNNNDAISINGSGEERTVLSDLTLTQGNLDLNGNTLTISGDIRPDSGSGTIEGSTASSTLVFDDQQTARTLETGDLNNNTIANLKIEETSGVTSNTNLILTEDLELTNGNLDLNGNTLTISGDIRPNDGSGTIEGSTASSTLVFDDQSTSRTIESGDLQNDEIANLTIDETSGITINTDINVTENFDINAGDNFLEGGYVLDINGATLDVASGADFTFKSSPADANTNAGSAQLAEITNPSSTTINGDVTTERYFTDNRAFRLIAPSLTTMTSINANWQEGGLNPGDPGYEAGYGTHITGSTTGSNGFDATPSGNPSLFTFDNANLQWNAISDTDNTNLSAGETYRLFIRGDRGVNLTSNSATATETRIRTTGSLSIGDIGSGTLQTDQPHFIGNPYQATVDLSALSLGNIQHAFIWDPTINTRGAYVTVDIDNNNNSIEDPNFTGSGTSDADKYLQTQQAVFLDVPASPGINSFDFTEASKATSQAQTTVFSYDNTTNDANISLRLLKNNSGSLKLTDGLKVRFKPNGDNGKTEKDARKVNNLDESIASVVNNQLISIEERAIPTDGESIQLFTAEYRTDDYIIEMSHQGLPDDLDLLLTDHYTDQSYVIGDGLQQISFSVDSNIPESEAWNRFTLDFVTTLSTDEEIALDFKVYPNPSIDGQVNIQLPNAIDQESIRLQVTDLLGKTVMQQTIPTDKNVQALDLGNLHSGVYLIKISTDNTSSVEKLIVK